MSINMRTKHKINQVPSFLFFFVFIFLLSLKPAILLRSIVVILRHACAPPARSYVQYLTTVCLFFF